MAQGIGEVPDFVEATTHSNLGFFVEVLPPIVGRQVAREPKAGRLEWLRTAFFFHEARILVNPAEKVADVQLAPEFVHDYAALAAVAIPPLCLRDLDIDVLGVHTVIGLSERSVRLPRARDAPVTIGLDILAESGDRGVLGIRCKRKTYLGDPLEVGVVSDEYIARYCIQVRRLCELADGVPIGLVVSLKRLGAELELGVGDPSILLPYVGVRGVRAAGLGMAGWAKVLLDGGQTLRLEEDSQKLKSKGK